MPSKASKTSERDLNISLPINDSAKDFPAGFIKTAFMLNTYYFALFKPFAVKWKKNF